MCLILFAYNYHPKYRLILAANRDEFYKRPTAVANYWEDNQNILGGRDLEKMGTWIGINKNGQFAAITNYRDPSKLIENAQSRGELVSNYLLNTYTPNDYLNIIHPMSSYYNGFNLLIGNISSLMYYSNVTKKIEIVRQGIHGLSNGLLNSSWPKVLKGKEKLEKSICKSFIEPNSLFEILVDTQQPKDDELPNTGLTLEWERLLSPIFIKSSNYGTRSSTVILIDNYNHVNFIERSISMDNISNWKEVSFEFDIETTY